MTTAGSAPVLFQALRAPHPKFPHRFGPLFCSEIHSNVIYTGAKSNTTITLSAWRSDTVARTAGIAVARAVLKESGIGADVGGAEIDLVSQFLSSWFAYLGLELVLVFVISSDRSIPSLD